SLPGGRLCRPHPQGTQARRPSHPSAGKIRACTQHDDRQGARPRGPAWLPRARRQGDRMNGAAEMRPTGALHGWLVRLRKSAGWDEISGPFFRKYVALFLAAICIILLSSAALDIWFSSRELKGALVRVQREQAVTASGTIEHFIDGIDTQLRWSVQLPWSADTFEQRRFDGLRLIQQTPAISE